MAGHSQTNQILVRYLKKWGITPIHWTNRTPLANEPSFVPWEHFQQGRLRPYTAICLATHSAHYLITQKILDVTKAELVLDLSVPANAEKSLVEQRRATYIGIEEINKAMTVQKKAIQSQLSVIDALVNLKAQKIQGLLQLRFSKDIFRSIVSHAEQAHVQAIQAAKSGPLAHLDPETQTVLEKWSYHLVRRVTHQQLSVLRSVLPVKETN